MGTRSGVNGVAALTTSFYASLKFMAKLHNASKFAPVKTNTAFTCLAFGACSFKLKSQVRRQSLSNKL